MLFTCEQADKFCQFLLEKSNHLKLQKGHNVITFFSSRELCLLWLIVNIFLLSFSGAYSTI